MEVIRVTPDDPRVGQVRSDGSTARWPAQFINGIGFNPLSDRYSRGNIGGGYFVVFAPTGRPVQVILEIPETPPAPPPSRRRRGVKQDKATVPDEDDSAAAGVSEYDED